MIDYTSIAERLEEEELEQDFAASYVEHELAKYIISDNSSSCWRWIGPQDGSGRPTMQRRVHGIGRSQVIYRVMHRLAYGFWPDQCRHLCGNSNCVNPDHLYSGTVVDNALDTLFHDYTKTLGFIEVLAPRDWGITSIEVTGEFLYDLYLRYEWRREQVYNY